MAWPLVAAAAVSAVSAVASNMSNKAAAKSQGQWAAYNSEMEYATTMNNLKANFSIARVNAASTVSAGKFNSDLAMQNTLTNVGIIQATNKYNSLLYEEELSKVWDSVGLDIELKQNQREVERGQIRAFQSASGTVMDQDSAGKVVEDQMTQEAMDIFVTKNNGDIQARDIINSRARSQWEGEMAVQKTLYEGRMASIGTITNASLQAGTQLTQASISNVAGQSSASSSLTAGLYGAKFTTEAGITKANNTLVTDFANIGASYLSSSTKQGK
jgi:hypothetical protein